jgi:hypothetical protein
MNETISFRASTAMVNRIAAMKKALGTAKTRIPFRWALQMMRSQRSGSTQGMYFASRIPMETPSIGITDTTVAPKNRPRRKSRRRSGVVKMI